MRYLRYLCLRYLRPIKLNLSDEEALRDVSEFLGCSLKELLPKARLKDTPEEDKLWREKNRRTKQDYRDYYSKNIHYLERQDYYHRKADMSFLYLIKERGFLLDYGCGTGMIDFHAKLKRPDIKLFLVDIPEAITKEYCIWRLRKYGIDFKWYDIPYSEDIKFKEKYDFIRCRDVLEHTFHPLKVVKTFFDSLNVGGYLDVDFVFDPQCKKENTPEAQAAREKTLAFIENNFKVLYAKRKTGRYLCQKR